MCYRNTKAILKAFGLTASNVQKQAQADAAVKAKYDAAVDRLEKLLTKRQERDNKELIKAFSESEKTLAEVIEFLQGNAPDESEC